MNIPHLLRAGRELLGGDEPVVVAGTHNSVFFGNCGGTRTCLRNVKVGDRNCIELGRVGSIGLRREGFRTGRELAAHEQIVGFVKRNAHYLQ
jgi:hypothetical protein